MISINDNNKINVKEPDDATAGARCGALVHALTKRFDKKDPKIAMAFLRSLYYMCDAMYKEIVTREEEILDKKMEAKLEAKFGKDYKEKLKQLTENDLKAIKEYTKKEGLDDGDTEQSDTTGNAADDGKFDSIECDKSDESNHSRPFEA